MVHYSIYIILVDEKIVNSENIEYDKRTNNQNVFSAFLSFLYS